jgi:hypothetical protein
MTTGHAINAETIRLRRQPKKTSSQAAITREPFNGEYRAELPVPNFIDKYNLNIRERDGSGWVGFRAFANPAQAG